MATTLERIRFRRGTAAQWTASNTVLASGEPGFETDTGKFKLGDGTTAWTSLAYEPTRIDWANVDGAPAFVTSVNGKTAASGSSSVSINAADVPDGTSKVIMTSAERSKLGGVQTGATANQTDTYLTNRANHVGVQDITTITGLVDALNGLVSASGSIRQLSDVSDVQPNEGDMYVVEDTTKLLIPVDPTTFLATIDPNTGKLAQSAEPLDFHPIKILEHGAQAPIGTRLDTILFEKDAAISLVPVYLDDSISQAANTNLITVTQALSVGQQLGLSVLSSYEAATPAFTTVTATYSTGAGTFVFANWSMPNVTAAVTTGVTTVTTAVPQNATLTLTYRDANGAAINRVHGIAVLYALYGLAASPIDQQSNGGGGSSSSMTAISASVGTDTSQANELAIGIAGWSSSSAPASRTLADTNNNWTKLIEVKSDNGNSARSLAVFYQVLDTIQRPSFTTKMTSSDGSTGQWAAQILTLKAAA